MLYFVGPVQSFFYFDNTLGFHHSIVFSCEADSILEADSLLFRAKGIVAHTSTMISCQIIVPNTNDES